MRSLDLGSAHPPPCPPHFLRPSYPHIFSPFFILIPSLTHSPPHPTTHSFSYPTSTHLSIHPPSPSFTFPFIHTHQFIYTFSITHLSINPSCTYPCIIHPSTHPPFLPPSIYPLFTLSSIHFHPSIHSSTHSVSLTHSSSTHPSIHFHD